MRAPACVGEAAIAARALASAPAVLPAAASARASPKRARALFLSPRGCGLLPRLHRGLGRLGGELDLAGEIGDVHVLRRALEEVGRELARLRELAFAGRLRRERQRERVARLDPGGREELRGARVVLGAVAEAQAAREGDVGRVRRGGPVPRHGDLGRERRGEGARRGGGGVLVEVGLYAAAERVEPGRVALGVDAVADEVDAERADGRLERERSAADRERDHGEDHDAARAP